MCSLRDRLVGPYYVHKIADDPRAAACLGQFGTHAEAEVEAARHENVLVLIRAEHEQLMAEACYATERAATAAVAKRPMNAKRRAFRKAYRRARELCAVDTGRFLSIDVRAKETAGRIWSTYRHDTEAFLVRSGYAPDIAKAAVDTAYR